MKFKSVLLLAAAIGTSVAFTSFTISSKENSAKKNSITTDTSDTKRVVINEQYSLEVPKHMKSTTELNDDASLQYQNTEEELYVIVIDETTDDFVKLFRKEKGWNSGMTNAENYRRVQMESIKKRMKIKGKPVVRKTKAGAVEMEIADFSGKVKGISFPIAYKIGFLETGKHLYMIMSWTLGERKSLHNNTMENMLKSFRSVD
ncbi:MAG: hypothetical protein ABIQ40_11700 [Bacteroidia bacterium]